MRKLTLRMEDELVFARSVSGIKDRLNPSAWERVRNGLTDRGLVDARTLMLTNTGIAEADRLIKERDAKVH